MDLYDQISMMWSIVHLKQMFLSYDDQREWEKFTKCNEITLRTFPIPNIYNSTFMPGSE